MCSGSSVKKKKIIKKKRKEDIPFFFPSARVCLLPGVTTRIALSECALSLSPSLWVEGGKGILSSTSFAGLSILFVHFVNPAVFFLFCFPPSSLMLLQLFLCLMVDAIFMSIILVPMRSERVSLSLFLFLSFVHFLLLFLPLLLSRHVSAHKRVPFCEHNLCFFSFFLFLFASCDPHTCADSSSREDKVASFSSLIASPFLTVFCL